jgi:predicted transcriptional regulator
MLDTARFGVSKTHLMYRCSLSFAQVTKYLDLVLKTRLVEVENNGPRLHFKTSGKGRAFLESYEGLMDLLE